METLIQDIRYGMRGILRNPSFAAVALLTLTIGIGATTAMFSVVNAVLFRKLPYAQPERLVMIRELLPKIEDDPVHVPAPDILEFRDSGQAFSAVAGYREGGYEFVGAGSPQRIHGARISATTFPMLGVTPLIGRAFSNDEDQPGHNVIVLSYAVWQREFGGDRGVIGRTVSLDREPYVVIGVMPRDFAYPMSANSNAESPQIWVPLALTPKEIQAKGDNFDYGIVARLKPGVSLEQARTDAARVARGILEQYPAEIRADIDMRAVVTPLSEVIFGDLRLPMLALLGAVLFILLIAAANVANLLLARATGRQKEIAVRIALGARPLRLLRQLLAESVTLALMGGVLGTLCAALATRALVALVPGNVPRLQDTRLDANVMLFALGISLVAGLVFGAAPAFFATRTRLNENLKEGGRGGSYGPQHRKLRSAFVVAEIALAMVLLFGAGLLVRSFQRLMELNPGFAADHLITASVSLPETQYPKGADVRKFATALLDRMQAIPGAKAVGVSTDLPLEANWTRIFTAEGYRAPAGGGMPLDAHSLVGGDYFHTMGIPLLRGRAFLPSDNETAPHVVIISEALARQFFPGQDPIGKRLKWGPPKDPNPWLTIIGVVGDVKQGPLDRNTIPHTYESYLQAGGLSAMHLAVRTSGDPRSVTASLKTAVWGLDRQLAVSKLRTMEQVLSDSSAPRRFNMLLVAIFAATALLLAAIGIYGVIAYSVAQRTHEIGIRMTLGAGRADVLRMVLGWGGGLIAIGTAIGVAGAVAAGRLLRGFLFGVQPSDPLTFAAVVAVLALIALLATYVPARRAMKVDPMVALRYE